MKKGTGFLIGVVSAAAGAFATAYMLKKKKEVDQYSYDFDEEDYCDECECYTDDCDESCDCDCQETTDDCEETCDCGCQETDECCTCNEDEDVSLDIESNLEDTKSKKTKK